MADIERLKRGWMRAGEKAAWVLGIVLFAVLYWLVFAPVALIAKLSGRVFFPKMSADQETYYHKRTSPPATIEEMRRQG